MQAKVILKWTGYVAFALVCYAIFLFYTFPVDTVLGSALAEAEKSGWRIETQSAQTTLFPPGILLKNVTLTNLKAGADASPIPLAEVGLSGPLWSLSGTSPAASFHLGLAGGSIDGSFELNQAAKSLTLDASIDDLSIKQLPGVSDTVPVPMNGRMSGDIDMVWNTQDSSKSTGTMTLSIEKGVIGPADQPLKLPKVNLGDFEGEIDIERGVATIRQWKSESDDAEIEIIGNVRLNRQPNRSRPNMTYRFKLSKKLAEDPTLKTVLTIANPAKAEDGFYYYKLTGTFDHPSFKPSKYSSKSWEKDKKNDAKSTKKSGAAKRGKAKKK